MVQSSPGADSSGTESGPNLTHIECRRREIVSGSVRVDGQNFGCKSGGCADLYCRARTIACSAGSDASIDGNRVSAHELRRVRRGPRHLRDAHQCAAFPGQIAVGFRHPRAPVHEAFGVGPAAQLCGCCSICGCDRRSFAASRAVGRLFRGDLQRNREGAVREPSPVVTSALAGS